ncbi:MAG: GDSL-type esterase/lipase family protein [Pirellulaceae bacterium]|jgi:hypothetical protein|nr:GDSL-type esterase/lipase family protein [Pirellulaceae bacterium]
MAAETISKTARRNRFQTKRGKFGLLLASTLLTLSATEIGFRIAGVRGEFHNPRVMGQLAEGQTEPIEHDPYGFVPHGTIRFTYASDPRGYFDPGNSIDMVHNSVGWRDVEHELEKPPNTYRIMGLGDSYLWGEGVRLQDCCLTKLEDLLQPGEQVRVETINTAFSSLNTVDQRDRLAYRGLAYEPDLVITFFVLNDTVTDWSEGPKVEFHEEYTLLYETPDALSRISHFWGWTRQQYMREVRARRFIRDCVESFDEDSAGWRQSRLALSDIQQICQRKGMTHLVVIFPFFHDLDSDDYPFQPIHDTVTKYCQKRKIPVLDLRDSYRSFRGPELWVHPTDQHPNETAHLVAAKAVAAYLKNHPKVYSPSAATGQHDEE